MRLEAPAKCRVEAMLYVLALYRKKLYGCHLGRAKRTDLPPLPPPSGGGR